MGGGGVGAGLLTKQQGDESSITYDRAIKDTASGSRSCKVFLVNAVGSTCGDMAGTQILRPVLALWPGLFCLVYRWPQ